MHIDYCLLSPTVVNIFIVHQVELYVYRRTPKAGCPGGSEVSCTLRDSYIMGSGPCVGRYFSELSSTGTTRCAVGMENICVLHHVYVHSKGRNIQLRPCFNTKQQGNHYGGRKIRAGSGRRHPSDVPRIGDIFDKPERPKGAIDG